MNFKTLNLKAIDNKFLMAIKVLSTVLIAGAIALAVWMFYHRSQWQEFPYFLTLIFWFATFALVSHFLEGVIGAFIAFRREQNAIATGIYIFFTGTVGLLEVLE